MFFQFSPPVKSKKVVKKEKDVVEEIELVLAPFTPNPKISLEGSKLGQAVSEKVIIKNPNCKSVEVLALLTIDEEINLELNWNQKCLNQYEQDILEITWIPRKFGSWRYVLQISAGKISKEIPIVLKASSQKKQKAPLSKAKNYPSYVAKKLKSPIRQRKSPLKEASALSIPKIIISPARAVSGKENNIPVNLTFVPENRRDTYIVTQEPVFDDSLENVQASPSISFEKLLNSNSFALTPVNEFNPGQCSTEEKSISKISYTLESKHCLFPENNRTFEIEEIKNVSSETYTKNLSSETFTKDLSSNTYTVDTSNNELTSPSISKKARLDSLSGISMKNLIEADLWAKPSNDFLSTIKEETFSLTQTPVKRKAPMMTVISPKRRNIEISWTKDKAASIVDPETGRWLERQEDNFKKWLNILLAPPSDLNSNEQHPIDVAKLWRDCQKRKNIEIPSVAVTSSKYQSLRKVARVMYKSAEVQNVLLKVWDCIDKNKMSIRVDRDVHLDLALQADIMSVLLSYNPLWLRLGLEAVFGKIINVKSNSDIFALTTFLSEYFIRDPMLLKKYKSIHTPQYSAAIKKHILKKFFALIYFLDFAKSHKLIAHDPCLFCKNAPIKESREALLKFSRDTLSSMGDVTKYLKHYSYVVHHKQTYLDEFDYTVTHLGADLRDGVRLTRVAEIILLRKDLSKNLLVPAGSRLQKVHNMNVVFDALKKDGFVMLYDIGPKDLVDGHKEKTLFFLWQLIYKFQTPLMEKSVTVIAKWWRSKPIVQKREELNKIRKEKTDAAVKIQRWYRKKLAPKRKTFEDFIKRVVVVQSYVRGFLQRRRFMKLKRVVRWVEDKYIAKKNREEFQKLKYSVLIIQQRFRANKLKKVEMDYYQKLKHATIFVQRRFKQKLERQKFIKLRNSVIFIQQKWRATLAMRKQRDQFEVLKATTIMIQRRFLANLQMRKNYYYYCTLKSSVITVQRIYRAMRAMRIEKNCYQQLRKATITLQSQFRRNYHRHRFLALKRTVIFVQRKWRAKVAMRKERTRFEVIKEATIAIQRKFRAWLQMKKDLDYYRKMKKVAVVLQTQFRCYYQRKKFLNLKRTVVFVQQTWRAKTAMRKARKNFETLKAATACIQNKFRVQLQMKKDLDNYQKMKKSAIVLQRNFRCSYQRKKFLELKKTVIFVQLKWRAKLAMRKDRKNFETLKTATVCIQNKFRANLQMKKDLNDYQQIKKAAIVLQSHFRCRYQRKKFLELKNSVIFVQRKWRAKMAMKKERKNFEALKAATVCIQNKFRANLQMKKDLNNYQQIKKAAIVLQSHFRCRYQRKKFLELKNSVIFVQRKWRAKMAMKKERKNFEALKAATVCIQNKFRANLQMKKDLNNYQQIKKAAIVLQSHFRCRYQRKKFLELKNSVIFVQRKWRAKMAMKKERKNFEALKAATVCIQNKFRAQLLMKNDLDNYQKIRKAAIVLQSHFRCSYQREKFLELKRAIIFVQQKWRAKIVMRKERKNFEVLKAASVCIQNKFRANLQMKKDLSYYQNLKKATILIQRKWRAQVAMRKAMMNYQILKERQKRGFNAITSLQKYAKGFLIRRKYAQFLTAEAIADRRRLRIENKAAAKIQAAWKSYKLRSVQSHKLVTILENLKKANQNAVPEKTLGSRLNLVLKHLAQSRSIEQILIDLLDLEFITRRCKKSLVKLAPVIAERFFDSIVLTNRSPPEIKVCTATVSVLINFYKFEPTKQYVWLPKYLEKLLDIMLYSCDKESELFPTVCTLMWLFAQNEEYRSTIVNSCKFKEKLTQIRERVERKVKMISKMNVKYQSFFTNPKNLPMPSILPDWGLDYKPKIFTNSVQALKSLWAIFKF